MELCLKIIYYTFFYFFFYTEKKYQNKISLLNIKTYLFDTRNINLI